MVKYRIDVRNHWWFDSGIVGLYFIAKKVIEQKHISNINLMFDSDSLTIVVENKDLIREFLECCYETLASQYWNISTKSQKENLELVLFNKETKEFSLAPKRQATPVVSNFVKGTSWKADGIDYDDMDGVLKTKTDEFQRATGKSLWGKKKKLLFSLPESHPNIKILPKENIKKQMTCSVCGNITSNLKEISQPSFLMFASKSAAQSFHSQGKRPAKICWECEFLSKFTMDTLNYKQDSSSLSILLLNSPSLEHSINNQMKIGSSSILRDIDDEYFYKNIGFDKEGLISKSRMSYELLWAYFVDTYSILKLNTSCNTDTNDDFLMDFLEDIISAPLEIIVMVLEDKGQTFITKELIYYNDVSFAYRLISHFISRDITIKKVYNSLYEKDNKGNLLPTRNNILRKMLNKHCILADIEAITYRKTFDKDYIDIPNINKFLTEYYLLIKEDIMNRDQIEIAVNLGKQIVSQPYLASGEDKDVLKKIRGDLFALRKTRTVTDFITQLNSLQFRYGISVSKSILEGILNEVPFEDFKGYCIMGALNNFNYYNSPRNQKGDKKDE